MADSVGACQRLPCQRAAAPGRARRRGRGGSAAAGAAPASCRGRRRSARSPRPRKRCRTVGTGSRRPHRADRRAVEAQRRQQHPAEPAATPLIVPVLARPAGQRAVDIGSRAVSDRRADRPGGSARTTVPLPAGRATEAGRELRPQPTARPVPDHAVADRPADDEPDQRRRPSWTVDDADAAPVLRRGRGRRAARPWRNRSSGASGSRQAARERTGRGDVADGASVRAQADSSRRPLRRRAETIARPARVRMRSRKPCVFARRRLFG